MRAGSDKEQGMKKRMLEPWEAWDAEIGRRPVDLKTPDMFALLGAESEARRGAEDEGPPPEALAEEAARAMEGPGDGALLGSLVQGMNAAYMLGERAAPEAAAQAMRRVDEIEGAEEEDDGIF
jgi:hypothetical protein